MRSQFNKSYEFAYSFFSWCLSSPLSKRKNLSLIRRLVLVGRIFLQRNPYGQRKKEKRKQNFQLLLLLHSGWPIDRLNAQHCISTTLELLRFLDECSVLDQIVADVVVEKVRELILQRQTNLIDKFSQINGSGELQQH